MSIERELRTNWDSVYYPEPEPVEQAVAPGQQPGDVLVAEAQRVHPRTGRPITGPTMSDITEPAMGLANIGAATVKGATQQFLGLPGDINAIGFGLKELINRGADESMTNAFVRGLQQKTILPTTQEVKNWLDTNIGTVDGGANPYETLGEVAGPGGQIKVGKAIVKGAAKLAPTAGEMAIKSMEKLGTPVQMGIVPPSPSMAETATKAIAPASDIGFYSAVEKAALNVQRKSGSGQSFLNDISKGENVKADEIKWIGLDDFLKGKKNVSKQEVQDFIANNKVDVQEVTLVDSGLKKKFSINSPADQDYYDVIDKQGKVIFTGPEDEADNMLESQTNFGKFTLPGGENYREILLTMPAKRLSEDEARKVLGAKPDAKLSDADISYASRKAADEYKSSHWDQSNVLAHIRVNDRVDADGKKMLLVEEVQSDWHQSGREKGYNTPEIEARRKELEKQAAPYFESGRALPPELRKEIEALPQMNAVPDAPMKDTWYQLALKRVLKYAAENGYDRVGLTTGKQQAERYNLAKQVDEVIAKRNEDGSFNISATLADGGGAEQSIGKNIPVDKLSDYVGKDLAKSIQAQEFGTDVYSGDQLKVGGEGMKKYYDDIYPKYLDKYGKKWGASIGETKVKTGRGVPGGEPVRYLDITPEMRNSVKKGQPLFSKVDQLDATMQAKEQA